MGQLSKLTGGNISSSSSSLRQRHSSLHLEGVGNHRKNGYWCQRETKEEKDGNNKLPKLETKEQSCKRRGLFPQPFSGTILWSVSIWEGKFSSRPRKTIPHMNYCCAVLTFNIIFLQAYPLLLVTSPQINSLPCSLHTFMDLHPLT